MKKTISIIGVPSSAGAHWPGQEKTPQYLRDAGFVKQLEKTGFAVVDFGDLPLVRFRPDKVNRNKQNWKKVLEVATGVSGKVASALEKETTLLIIGGDCTISLGVIAGFITKEEDIGLLYFDGHVDLNTPITSVSGILDSMGIAHMIGAEGTVKELTHIGKRFPLLPKEKIVLFGYNPKENNKPELELLEKLKIKNYSLEDIGRKGIEAANEALKYLEKNSKKFLVHLDVDVIDFTDLPVADVPQYSQGMMFKEILDCLSLFVSSSKFGGLVIAEFNPDHLDEEGKDAAVFIDGIVNALA
jgi:arginase